MSSISIILSYGVFIKPNPDYQVYLDSALNQSLATDCDYIILCGGVTNPTFPNLSESESVGTHFNEVKPNLKSKIILDTSSLTTPQNLEHAHKLITSKNLNPSIVNIFCDTIRSPKIFYLALTVFYPDLSEKEKLEILQNIALSSNHELAHNLIRIRGIPLSNSIEIATNQIIASMLEMHYFDYPDLHEQFVKWRKRQWGIK
ncbi:MAG: hypothetical protein WCT01_00505 [Candidatus Shapirobacteria bacterium]|jgi:hypothetical protein